MKHRKHGDSGLAKPFDDIGAEAAGMRAAWVNRSGGLFDTLAPRPEMVVATLTELADALGARAVR